MRKSIIAVLLTLSTFAAGAVELYKWVDKDGVHYSDQPAPGAEKIEVHGVPNVGATPVPPPAAPAAPAAGTFAGYEQFAVTEPPDNGIIRDNSGAGEVSVTVSLTPALREDLGHTVRVTLAGQTQGGAATQFSFTGIDRGTHTISAAVIDGAGSTLQTTTATFTLQRTSILQKKPSPTPAPGPAPSPSPAPKPSTP
ncbi:MAG: hypothetical protein HONDAALG_00619 [Gammaproteobacteria bacterium]|nr:hypothetical protein [Gammaproteobacteria bacterium]